MNERIRELNLQAMSIVMNGSDPDGDVEQMYIPSEFTKKFAELIVRECVSTLGCEIVYNDNYTEKNKIISDMMELLKQHFGVKE